MTDVANADPRAERALLGSLIIDPEAFAECRPFVVAEDFSDRRFRLIFEAMLWLYERRTPADYVTLAGEMQERGTLQEIGGASVLTALINESPTSMHALTYAIKVSEIGELRRRLSRGITPNGTGIVL